MFKQSLSRSILPNEVRIAADFRDARNSDSCTAFFGEMCEAWLDFGDLASEESSRVISFLFRLIKVEASVGRSALKQNFSSSSSSSG